MPKFPYNKGPEVFKGKALHTIEYCKLDNESTTDLVKGKKVVVIGFKKSATDIAMECAQENQGKRNSCMVSMVCPNVYDEAILSLFNDSNISVVSLFLAILVLIYFSLYNYSKHSQLIICDTTKNYHSQHDFSLKFKTKKSLCM